MPRRTLLALSLLLLTLAGCGGQAASGGDDPASAVPADAAMYFEATLRLQGSQRSDALAAAGKVLATDDPEAKIEQLVAAPGKGKVVIAYGEAAASEALEPSQKLGDSPAYEEAKAQLGDGFEPGFLVAMPPVVSLIGAAAEDKAEFAKAKPYLDAFSVIAAGGKVDGDAARSRVVAGLR